MQSDCSARGVCLADMNYADRLSAWASDFHRSGGEGGGMGLRMVGGCSTLM